MISYLIVFCFTFQSLFIAAIPVFPNNQVQGQPILPYQPGGFDLQSNLALLLQDCANKYHPYPPAFNNQFCPCQNQGNNWNGLNQLDLNNILNNPIVQNLLGPNYNQKENEIKISGQLQNYPVSSKVPSVVNNYIVIPPEAFIKIENEKPHHKPIETQQITNSSKNNQIKRTKNHKQGRRRSGNKKENPTKVSTTKNVIDKEIEVFNESDGLEKKESLKIRPRKSKNNKKSKLKNCKKENGVVVEQPKTCEAMNVKKENNCCPENRSAKHLVNDFNLMNFHQMFPFYPGFSPNVNIEESQNQCCGNQMMYPDFSSFYNNPYLFDYQQLFNNPNENINQELDSGNPIRGNNRVNVQNKNRPSKKPIPTVILNVKTVNAESKTNKKEENTHESIKENTTVDIIEDKITSDTKSSGRSTKMMQLNKKDEKKVTENKPSKKPIPTVILNVKTVNADVKAESITNKKEESTPESIQEDTPEDFIVDKTTSDTESSGRSAKMMQLNKEDEKKVTKLPKTPITSHPETTTIKNEVETTSTPTSSEDYSVSLTVPNSSSINNVKNISTPEFSSMEDNVKISIPELKDDVEEVIVPELESEDEVPTFDDYDIIEEYYPDFRNDNKNHDVSEAEDINDLIDENDHVDLSRERRKLEQPLHEYNYFRQQQHPSRNYYKLDQDPALNEIATTDDPKLTKTFSEIETHTTVESNDVSGEEIMYFITPPSLDKIDFETKQVNKENNGESLQDKETDDIKEKRFFVNSKSSTFSNAKVPYNMNHKPKKDVLKNTSPLVHYVETAYGQSKVATYGRIAQVEDTLDKSMEDVYSSEISAEKPFIVMAQPAYG